MGPTVRRIEIPTRGWTMKDIRLWKATLLLIFAAEGFAAQAGLVASYSFYNSLAAQEGGVVALVPINPLGANGFVSDTVFGQTRTVYAFNGNAMPIDQQAGLELVTSGLIAPNNYSVAMIFKFTQNNDLYRRILDVQDGAADSGFYVDVSNLLRVYPVGWGTTQFTNDVYHQVVLTDANTGVVKLYLDGGLEATMNTTLMDINNVDNLLIFFRDNNQGSYLNEYSSGRVALIQLFDSILSDAEVAALYNAPFSTSAQQSRAGENWSLYR
jgi:hypothetical protein